MAFSLHGYKHEGYLLLVTTSEKALETQQTRYQQLFEHANDGIFILDRQARFVEVNQKFAEMTGLSREEIVGKTTELFFPGRFAQSRGERSPGEVGGITLTNLLFAVARREAECPRRKPDSSE